VDKLFSQRLVQIHELLSIPADFADSCPLPIQEECKDLCYSENDCFDRPQQMTPATFRSWQIMRQQAAAEGIVLTIVSAFRSIDYQYELIRKKLTQGQSIEAILNTNAAPGFSEHHTGRAIDLTTDGVEPLTEEFELTGAFRWLESNADQFGFNMSFPRDNSLGIIYEPWHWLYSDPDIR
jgi:D-alanyl-D-alanine carboxypeptidase